MQNTIGKLAVGHLQEVRSFKVLMLNISRLTGEEEKLHIIQNRVMEQILHFQTLELLSAVQYQFTAAF